MALPKVPPLAIFTAPSDAPVLIFVAKFEPAFKLTAAPDIVAPNDPVNNPEEVIVPPPVVEIAPLVVTASPDDVGERVVPNRFQNPIVPVVGGAEVRFLNASV
jgi:hypothetical protein